MSAILWGINSVKVNVPDVYSAEYPEAGITVSCGVNSEEIAKNTGNVKYVFCVKYNDGVIMCDDYTVDKDGKVTIDLPVGLSCELVGNTMTVKKKDEPSGEPKLIKLTLTNNRAGAVFFSACKIENGKIYTPFMLTVKSGATKEMNIGYSMTGGVSYFCSVVAGTSKPVFSAVFTGVTDNYLRDGNYDIYKMKIPSTFKDDEIICTVT